MKKCGGVMALILLLATAAPAGDFGDVVKNIETSYGMQRSYPYLLGFALFLGKPIMWAHGVGDFKLALFENPCQQQKVCSKTSLQQLEQLVHQSLGNEWKPFVRVSSQKTGEATIIYASNRDSDMNMLVAAIDPEDMVVVKMKLDAKTLQSWTKRVGAKVGKITGIGLETSH